MSESISVEDQLEYLRKKISNVRISARKDLSVSRHLFQGKPYYIIHDPISITSHRLGKYDYQILSALNPQENLSCTFERLVSEGIVKRDEEHSFYKFVLSLQTRGLLNLPVTDCRQLYDRHAQRSGIQRGNLLNQLMFLKIPIFNPNNLLDRTLHLAKPLFTKWFFVFWLLMIFSSFVLVVNRWEDFSSPLEDLLATRNLFIFVCVMTLLKFWHELGHAFACKVAGGIVPDMGVFFMVGMPMAYVDVSSSWSFPSKFSRMLVGFGGIYFESIAAAIGVFVWAFTPVGLVHSAAHFTVIMAGLMTLFINANPLMRFDGYYVLSDVLGMPNLRQRSTNYLKEQFKIHGLGLQIQDDCTSLFERITLSSYGIAASVYQVVLVLSISIMLAHQYFLVGIILGASFVASSLIMPMYRSLSYLFSSAETKRVRRRAAGWGIGIAFGAVVVVSLVPAPAGIVAQGQFGFTNTQIVRLPFVCQIAEVSVEPNQEIGRGQTIMKLTNSDIDEQYYLAAAKARQTKAAVLSTTHKSAAEYRKHFCAYETNQRRLDTAKSYLEQLDVQAEFGGRILKCPEQNDVGCFREVGEELVRIGHGKHVVRCLLNSDQFSTAQPNVGQKTNIRLHAKGVADFRGTISRIEPAGSNKIAMTGLTHVAAGNIIVDPNNGVSNQTYFLVEIDLDQPASSFVPEKTTASVRFKRNFETIGMQVLRRFKVLLRKLSCC